MQKEFILLNNQIMQKDKNTGFYQLEKDKEAVAEYMNYVLNNFLPELKVIDSYYKRLKYLCENGYYTKDLLDGYTEDEIKTIADKVYSYDFKFESYMAISKFYQSYALKTDDKKHYLELYEDRIIVCALFLAKYTNHKNQSTSLFDDAYDYAVSMIEQRYQPATPTFLNSGRARSGELVSCFLLEADDSLNSIYYNISTCAQLSKAGGGVAVSLSKLRSRNEPIKGIEGAASGVIPVMKLMEDTFGYVNQLG